MGYVIKWPSPKFYQGAGDDLPKSLPQDGAEQMVHVGVASHLGVQRGAVAPSSERGE